MRRNIGKPLGFWKKVLLLNDSIHHHKRFVVVIMYSSIFLAYYSSAPWELISSPCYSDFRQPRTQHFMVFLEKQNTLTLPFLFLFYLFCQISDFIIPRQYRTVRRECSMVCLFLFVSKACYFQNLLFGVVYYSFSSRHSIVVFLITVRISVPLISLGTVNLNVMLFFLKRILRFVYASISTFQSHIRQYPFVKNIN